MAASEIATANNNFGLNLFKLLLESNKDKNTFMSPFSISVALAMTQLGARSKTASGMSSCLQWNASNANDIHGGYQAYLSKLQKPCDLYQLSTANRIFIEQKYPVLAEFLQKTKKWYLAEAVSANFSGAFESERQKINTWVSDQTQDKIKDLLPSGALNPDTIMVLVNAIYFKGKWDSEFDPEMTRPQQFHTSPSTTKMVPMMYAKQKFSYTKSGSLKCTAIEIPYKGKELGMVIVLPDDHFGLGALVKNLTPVTLANLLGKLQGPKQEVQLTMPKFEVNSSFQLKQALSVLGMSEAFDLKNADFSGMTEHGSQDLYISEVFHKAYVKVNEEGTEAAAATGVVMMMRCAMVRNLVMVLDHPFLFMIIDKSANDSILFMGKIVDPSAE